MMRHPQSTLLRIISSHKRHRALHTLTSLNPIPSLTEHRTQCKVFSIHHNHQTTRTFARSSATTEETPEDKARTFILSLGHEPRIAQGVVDALSKAGMSGGMLLSTVRTMAGRLEVGEDAGLDALIASVEQELARTDGKAKVTMWCVPPGAWKSEEYSDDSNGTSREDMMKAAFPVEGYEGMSLTDVAKFGDGEGASTLAEYIECACSGIMACSTCHVVLDGDWADKAGEPIEAEQDMIDLAYQPELSSRLGCQVVLSPELDGMVVKIPRGANNLMDHIPFDG